MAEQVKPEGPDVGETSEAENGGPEFQRTPGKAEGEDKDPTVDADSIFRKLEQQSASERGTQDEKVAESGPETTSKD